MLQVPWCSVLPDSHSINLNLNEQTETYSNLRDGSCNEPPIAIKAFYCCALFKHVSKTEVTEQTFMRIYGPVEWNRAKRGYI
jgi:hypothetical protein